MVRVLDRRTRLDWYVRYGIRRENLRLRPHAADELAHYAKGCADVEYNFPIGWSELEGIANRTDFDLRAPLGVRAARICATSTRRRASTTSPT